MHIKYVVVEGFRVYRDRIELAPLSPKHNVVGEPPGPPRSTPRTPLATAHPRLLRCAVGANGAGKSNLFNGACRRLGRSLPCTPAPADTEAHARALFGVAAIQFVLGDLTGGQLRADERKSMLHEGGGAHVMSAYVEIYFDNSTGRFPTEKDEVRTSPSGWWVERVVGGAAGSKARGAGRDGV